MRLNRVFGSEARVGVSDAGILGFYADYDVLNLDGVVNSEVIPYIRDGRLIDYLRARQITHFLVRPEWKQPWMMGRGSGLLYRNQVLELPSAVAGEPASAIEVGELLHGNAAIHAEHFSEHVALPGRALGKHLGAGWSPLLSEHQTHVWSDAAASELLLPLRDGRLYDVVFRLEGFEPVRGHVDVEVFVDDARRTRFRVPHGASQEYSVRIGPRLHELTRIRFVYSGTRNPKQLGVSQDDRDLAVSLTAIRIVELETAGPPDGPARPG